MFIDRNRKLQLCRKTAPVTKVYKRKRKRTVGVQCRIQKQSVLYSPSSSSSQQETRKASHRSELL